MAVVSVDKHGVIRDDYVLVRRGGGEAVAHLVGEFAGVGNLVVCSPHTVRKDALVALFERLGRPARVFVYGGLALLRGTCEDDCTAFDAAVQDPGATYAVGRVVVPVVDFATYILDVLFEVRELPPSVMFVWAFVKYTSTSFRRFSEDTRLAMAFECGIQLAQRMFGGLGLDKLVSVGAVIEAAVASGVYARQLVDAGRAQARELEARFAESAKASYGVRIGDRTALCVPVMVDHGFFFDIWAVDYARQLAAKVSASSEGSSGGVAPELVLVLRPVPAGNEVLAQLMTVDDGIELLDVMREIRVRNGVLINPSLVQFSIRGGMLLPPPGAQLHEFWQPEPANGEEEKEVETTAAGEAVVERTESEAAASPEA